MRKELQKAPVAYEVPTVEVIEVEVEQGFAASETPRSNPLEAEDWD